ncbi:MAG: hypothetical protein LBK94_08445 [Prevotellaceae bacterium]|jgi:hypothetical protein|nr:hypothetical protein [Prevotellaceae bacterium]
MQAENPYVKLFQLILPLDIASFFDLVDVTEEDVANRRALHLYLDEKPVVPAGYKFSDLSPNGFMRPEVFKIFRYVTGMFAVAGEV